MAQYTIDKIEFEGGCFNCPFCTGDWPRNCRLLTEKIEWRHTGGELTFDPYKQRLKPCPLKRKKCTKKKQTKE